MIALSPELQARLGAVHTKKSKKKNEMPVFPIAVL